MRERELCRRLVRDASPSTTTTYNNFTRRELSILFTERDNVLLLHFRPLLALHKAGLCLVQIHKVSRGFLFMNEEYRFGKIYKITNKINGKSYIGQTVRDLKYRLTEHLKPNSSCNALSRAVEKYGRENFYIETLGIFLEDLLNLAEIAAIKEHNTITPNGYNIMEGGNASKLSDETKAKISKALTGIKHSKEHIAKVLATKAANGGLSKEIREKLARLVSGENNPNHGGLKEETKRKISEAQSGEKHWNYGGTASKETRAKRSAAMKGRKPCELAFINLNLFLKNLFKK